jgi:hypothetical protein
LLVCLAQWNPDVPEALAVKAYLKRRAIIGVCSDAPKQLFAEWFGS